MIVQTVPVTGAITTNTYFYIDNLTKHGFLIDPGAQADKLLKIITDNNWTIEKILLTHGHFDHIGAVNTLQKRLNITCITHINGKQYLTNPEYNLSAWFGSPLIVSDFQSMPEGSEFSLSTNPKLKLQMIATPGHTQDAVIYYDKDNHLTFVGDTIFKNSYGRTDIPGGNEAQLLQSITRKILTLPPDTILYSGHSAPTDVAAERDNFDL